MPDWSAPSYSANIQAWMWYRSDQHSAARTPPRSVASSTPWPHSGNFSRQPWRLLTRNNTWTRNNITRGRVTLTRPLVDCLFMMVQQPLHLVSPFPNACILNTETHAKASYTAPTPQGRIALSKGFTTECISYY